MELRDHVPLAPYTTLQVGGPARYFAVVSSVEELAQARQFAQQAAAPVLVLGGGSNLLVNDQGFAGLVLHNQIMGREYTPTDTGQCLATFGAGEPLDSVIAQTVEQGYWGLENLSHIPGTVGATPVQNVGAYGVEVSDLITAVRAYHLVTGEDRTFTSEDCQFGYRDSVFKTPAGRHWCITHVTFALSIEPRPQLEYKDLASLATTAPVTQQAIREQVITIRSTKFPDWHTVGTAGSFFKNPIIAHAHAQQLQATFPDLPVYSLGEGQCKVSLGYILDRVCGLKGYTNGTVKLYENQALVLINTGTSAAAITAFAADVADQVKQATGIIIDQEVTTV